MGAARSETSIVISWPKPPAIGEATEYDYRYVATYARLLEAEMYGASEAELARSVLLIDPAQKPRVAQIAVRSHLRRAHWLLDQGFGPLLWCLND